MRMAFVFRSGGINWRSASTNPEACLHYSGGYPPLPERDHVRPRDPAHPDHRSPPAACRRAAQLRRADRRRARRVRGERHGRVAGGHRAAGQRGDRHALPQLPHPPGPLHVGLRRRRRGALRLSARELYAMEPWDGFAAWLERFTGLRRHEDGDEGGAEQGLADVQRLPRGDVRRQPAALHPRAGGGRDPRGRRASTTSCAWSRASSPPVTWTTSSATACSRSRSTGCGRAGPRRSRAAARGISAPPGGFRRALRRRGSPRARRGRPPRRRRPRGRRSPRCCAARGFGVACSGAPSTKREVEADSACENSDGITKTLFALPCAAAAASAGTGRRAAPDRARRRGSRRRRSRSPSPRPRP